MEKSMIRLRMSAKDAHYGGNLVDGAHMVHLFGDVATELLIMHDGDEGLFVAYDNVEFLAPVYAGDYIEATGEIVREAKSAVDAGAAIVHLHVREDDGTPTQSKARFKECIDAIYKVCPDVILIPSTGGAVGMTAEERLQPTELFPEMATLDCGTCNF